MLTDPLQATRRTNLRRLIAELKADGIATKKALARALGMPADTLDDLCHGAHVTAALARDIEWAMNLPRHWLDCEHDREPA
jgi:plasmid maintenance system antidote protein VapI